MASREIERLTKSGEDAALAGAMDYARARNCDIDAKRLGEELQRRIEAALPDALLPFQTVKGRRERAGDRQFRAEDAGHWH